LCLFCRGGIESKEHLFFHCGFSKRIWREVLRSRLILDPCVEWDDVIQWSISELKSGGLKSILCKLSISAVVYHLWKQRNHLKHGNTPKSEETIIA